MSLVMLDANRPLDVPDADVLAWLDTGGPDVVWVVPGQPRMATAPDGQPDVSLLLYRRGAQTAPPEGGQLTLTVELVLDGDELDAVRTAADALRPQPDGRDDPPLPPVQVRVPTWLDGTVHVELAEGLTADGQPSLMGDNRCLLALQLDAAQAATAQRAWEDGFAEATVELAGNVEGVATAAATVTGRSAGPLHTEQVTVAAAASNAVGVPLRLRGPLRLPYQAQTTRRTDLTL